MEVLETGDLGQRSEARPPDFSSERSYKLDILP